MNAQPEKQQLVHFERLVQEKRYDLAWKKLEQQKLDLMNKVQENAPSFRQSFENMVELNMQNLPNSSVSDYEKMKQAQTLVVVYDAIVNKKAPLWHKWKEELEISIQEILHSNEVTESQVKAVMYQWEVISPVLKMYLPEGEYKELEADFDELYQNSTWKQDSTLESVFQQMSLIDLESLQKQQQENYLLWLMLVVGGFIFLSLSYVGWVRYKAEGK